MLLQSQLIKSEVLLTLANVRKFKLLGFNKENIIGRESDDNIVQPELKICTEQQFRVVQIRNAISSFLKIKMFPLKTYPRRCFIE